MKRLSNFAPILLAALLAMATFWLEQIVRNERVRGLGESRHDPDSYVDKFQIDRFDVTGARQSRINGTKLVHYPDTDTAEVEAPTMRFDRTDRVLSLSSERALITNDSGIVILQGKVRGISPATESKPLQTISTDELTVDTNNEIASTKKPVVSTHGTSHLEGLGGEWDNINGMLRVYGQVRATIPNKSEKP